MDEQETEAMANARATRDVVLDVTLWLALKVIEHVDGQPVSYAVMEETVDAGGFEWELRVSYGDGFSFVRVQGTPQRTGGEPAIVTGPEEMAAVMGAQSASFDTQVPRAWVERARAWVERAYDGGEELPS